MQGRDAVSPLSLSEKKSSEAAIWQQQCATTADLLFNILKIGL